jgi:elongation factor P--(R)-beta-lysine ligase
MNLTDLLQLRQTTLDAVRRFFRAEGFIEVETPMLVPSPGLEPHLDPFRLTGGAYLPTSPEYAMKKLLAAGSGSLFQISKAFRDEPANPQHLPEFTMLEWYRVGADYRVTMQDTERLCAAVATAVTGGTRLRRQGGSLDLTPPYERLSVREAFRRFAGMTLTFGESADELRSAARRADCPDIADDDTWDEMFFKVFLRHVEPKLGRERPTLLYDYPARMAALARIKGDDATVCERFELYAGGLELANAFSELTDPVEQRRRFDADNAERRSLGRPELPIDHELIAALERGLPECSGNALGLDRLIMLLVDEPDIRNVVALAPQP